MSSGAMAATAACSAVSAQPIPIPASAKAKASSGDHRPGDREQDVGERERADPGGGHQQRPAAPEFVGEPPAGNEATVAATL